MGKKKSNNNGGVETKINDGAEKKNGGDGAGDKKKEEGPITVVLKLDFHCEGCGTKIVRTVRSFQGVESVKPESKASKLTVVGTVDPTNLKDKLAARLKRKVDLISPQPKKDTKGDEKKPEKPADDAKKPKEPPVTTAVMKLDWHCQGCVQKIERTVKRTQGFHEMSLDRDKDCLTVKGTMDMKELAEILKVKLKRPVDIVPPKKEKEKEKPKDGGENGGGGGNQTAQEQGGGAGNMNRMEHPGQPGFGQVPNGMMVYGPGYGGYGYPIPPPPMPVYTGNPLHAPQIFSDENPNACSIM